MRGAFRRVVGRGLAVLLCVVLLAGPVAAQSSVSEQTELAAGRYVASELIAEFGLVSDADWIGFLAQIRDRLLPFSGRPTIPYRIVILPVDVPTALSTPGWIFVTTGLIRLGPDADGWAFIIAHEMSHTAKRHVAAMIEKSNAAAIFSTLVGILTGSRAAVDIVRLLIDVAMLGFSRDLESEADIEALRMMVEAGYDPAKAAQTLAWFNQATGRREEQTHWTGTHPGFADRIVAVNAAYAKFAERGLPLRVKYLREQKETSGVIATANRLAEMADSWVLSLSLENTRDTSVTIFGGQIVLTSPDGDLPVRFLRSSLPGEIGPKSRISGDLIFEKRTPQWPTTVTLPVLLPDSRVDLQLSLTASGLYAPAPPASPLPRPPAAP